MQVPEAAPGWGAWVTGTGRGLPPLTGSCHLMTGRSCFLFVIIHMSKDTGDIKEF